MKKSKLFAPISLAVACLLGAGGLAAAVNHAYSENGSFLQAKAAVTEVATLDELQAALATASSSTEIVVTQKILITTDVTINGNGATVRVPIPYLTESGTRTANPSNFGVFEIGVSFESDVSVTINNLTICGGKDTDIEAAVFCNSRSYLAMNNVNITRSFGGFKSHGSAVFKNCSIVRNASDDSGAGIYNTGKLVLDNCTVSENFTGSTSGPYYEYGASGIGLSDSGSNGETYIINSVISNNVTSGANAGITVYDHQLYMFNSTVTGNVAYNTSTSSDYAAGISVNNTCWQGYANRDPWAVNSIITDNVIINRTTGAVTKKDLMIKGGRSQWEGFSSTFNLRNCLYSSNPGKGGDYDGYNSTSVKQVETNTVAHQYRNDGAVALLYSSSAKDYSITKTQNYSHPLTRHIGSDLLKQYVPIQNDGAATSGGTNSYINYSVSKDSSSFKAGYGTDSSINKVKDLTKATSGDKVTKYFEGTSRNANVIGACGVESDTHYLVTLNAPTLGSVKGATIFGDAYLASSSVNLTATADSGSVFSKWIIEGAASSEFTTNPYSLTVNEDKIVTAQFNKVYTLSYNANGGSGTVPTSQSAPTGDTVIVQAPTSLSRTGYTFVAWNTSNKGTGTSYDPGALYTMGTANATLYAKWSANSYNVTLHHNDGTSDVDNVTATYDANMPAITIPQREGYVFNGYYTLTEGGTKYYNANGSSAKKWDIASASDLYAQWLLEIDYTATGYTGPYDGQSHTISVQVSKPAEDVTIKYGTSSGSINLDTPPEYTNVKANEAAYTIWFRISATGYATVTDSRTVVLQKIDSTFDAPKAKENLVYTGESLELIDAGSTSDGTMKYSLEEAGTFTTDIPTGLNVGKYVVYYKVTGDGNHKDSAVNSVEVTISENDKTALVAAIAEAEELYNSILESHPEVAATLKEAIDLAKEVNADPNVTIKQIEDAIEALKTAIDKAKDDSRTVITDKDTGVTIETNDGTGIPTNINLKVEVRTGVKAQKGSAEYKNIQKMLAKNEKISNVFEIKLIKTVDGVETEIQPSDIKDGMKLIVHISLPDKLKTKGLRILHIHNDGEMEFIENAKFENNEAIFEVSSLSELAFVTLKTGIPGWAVALIVIGSLFLILGLAYFLLFFVFNKWIKANDQAVRVMRFALGSKDGKGRYLSFKFKFEYRDKEEVFSSKQDALK